MQCRCSPQTSKSLCAAVLDHVAVEVQIQQPRVLRTGSRICTGHVRCRPPCRGGGMRRLRLFLGATPRPVGRVSAAAIASTPAAASCGAQGLGCCPPEDHSTGLLREAPPPGGGGVWYGMVCPAVSGRRIACPSRSPLRARGRGSSRHRHRAGWCTQGGFGLWAYLPESEEGLRGPRSAALGKLGSGAPHSPFGHAASGRGTRLLL